MIKILHEGTFFTFDTRITVHLLWELLDVNESRFPMLFPLAETFIEKPFSDPDLEIPPGLYKVQITPRTSRTWSNGRKTSARLRRREAVHSSDDESTLSNVPIRQRGIERRAFSPRKGFDSDTDDSGSHSRASSQPHSDDLEMPRRNDKIERFKLRNEIGIERGDTDDETASRTESDEASSSNDDRFNPSRNAHEEFKREKTRERPGHDEDWNEKDLPALPRKQFQAMQETSRYETQQRNHSESSETESRSEYQFHGGAKDISSMKNFQYSENDRQFDNDMQAGISAMTAAVASIPERYYKYNAILSAKMDNALCRIDLINREMKKQIGNVSKTRILQMQILNLLHAIWKTAWAKFSPKARIQQAADSPFSIGETIHAETCLNRLHMWKRIVETESVNPNELLKRSFRELQEAPTHLFRCNPYTPPHIYVAGYEMKGGRTFGAASDGLDELISEVRLAFMDLAVREKVHRDVEMDSILTEVVDSYRATEVDSGTKSGTDWGYITQKLRKEFWLSKKPSDLEDRLERWAKSSKNVSHQGTEEGRGLRDKGQRNCMVARKKGVRWEEDRYY